VKPRRRMKPHRRAALLSLATVLVVAVVVVGLATLAAWLIGPVELP
jgi:FlaG/FlaF family flagellin (archaellin)